MTRKITLRDIAAKARVGTATVERVLNGRGGVSPETTERVIAAARKLDYPKRLPGRHRGVIRIEVILVRPETLFFSRLMKAFERIAATLDPSIAVHRTFLREGDPLAIAGHIENPGLRRSALILAVPEHPAIRAALVKLKAEGIPIIQIVTRMAGLNLDYVGIDNEAAGRMAGLLMTGLQKRGGSVIALCHSQVYAVQRERVRGFSEYLLRRPDSHLRFREVAFARDDEVESVDQMRRALVAYPDLVGIYNAGGGNTGLCDGLRRYAPEKGLCLIGHELTKHSGVALKDGIMAAVMDQAPETQARRSLDLVLNRLGLLDTAVDRSPIRFITVTAENA
jgi:LacI family transcriptional regulator